jgi:hypothetical protein
MMADIQMTMKEEYLSVAAVELLDNELVVAVVHTAGAADVRNPVNYLSFLREPAATNLREPERSGDPDAEFEMAVGVGGSATMLQRVAELGAWSRYT